MLYAKHPREVALPAPPVKPISLPPKDTPQVKPVATNPPLENGPAKAGYGVTLGNIKGLKSTAKEKLEAAGKNKEALAISMLNLQTAWDSIVMELTADKIFFRNAIHQGHISFEGLRIDINVYGVAYDFLKAQRLKLLDYFKHYYQNDEINVLINEQAPAADKMIEQVMSTREIFDKMAQ